MAKKTYVVAEGMAFTAMGHIFSAGEEIPEGAFADKVYMAKMISEKKIIEAKKTEEKVEAPAEKTEEKAVETPAEEKAEAPTESTGTKKSTSKGGK